MAWLTIGVVRGRGLIESGVACDVGVILRVWWVCFMCDGGWGMCMSIEKWFIGGGEYVTYICPKCPFYISFLIC